MDAAREEKARLRALARSIAPATATESEQVVESVREAILRQDWRVALTFLAMPGEVDLGSLAQAGLTLAVTRTPPRGPLTIHLLTDELEDHPFGYKQPTASAPEIASSGIDVVLVPGILFGEDGGRLGHGRGYYDTLLSSLHPRPFLIGVTLARRIVDHVPMTDSDVWMDAVATELGFSEARAKT
ncbi:MAG TPA: 5-formyltetrahydrofolate cyclo-ligase [Acidimicrobiia bacterium]